MNKILVISILMLLGLILAACSGSASPTPAAPTDATSGNTTSSATDLTRTKEEAAVIVKVTPLNLGDPSAATLDFEIALDTHSVDLAYDMRSIAALRNDAGEEVQAVTWKGPAGGGHHMGGTLSFPQMKGRGKSLTLILRGIADVPERTFVWSVTE